MELQTILNERRTIRRFKQVQVLESEIRTMLDAARVASSAANLQRLRYLVIQNRETVEEVFRHTAWAGYVTPRRTPQIGIDAPLTFIVVTGPEEVNNVLFADAGAALQSMELAGWDVGVGCCWIGSFEHGKVRKILNLPPSVSLLYLLAVGYPDESPIVEDVNAGASIKYYLDDNDVLHVPKYTADAITDWIR